MENKVTKMDKLVLAVDILGGIGGFTVAKRFFKSLKPNKPTLMISEIGIGLLETTIFFKSADMTHDLIKRIIGAVQETKEKVGKEAEETMEDTENESTTE